MSRLRSGIFTAPFHPAGENPTYAEQQNQAVAHVTETYELEVAAARPPEARHRGACRRARLLV